MSKCVPFQKIIRFFIRCHIQIYSFTCRTNTQTHKHARTRMAASVYTYTVCNINNLNEQKLWEKPWTMHITHGTELVCDIKMKMEMKRENGFGEKRKQRQLYKDVKWLAFSDDDDDDDNDENDSWMVELIPRILACQPNKSHTTNHPGQWINECATRASKRASERSSLSLYLPLYPYASLFVSVCVCVCHIRFIIKIKLKRGRQMCLF